MRVPIALLTTALLIGEQAMSAPVIAPAPAEEALSEFYAVRVDGQAVPVYACRVSAQPFNQVWPGYQRPLDQTELAGFALWDQSGPVTITIDSRRAPRKVVVRPRRLGIVPKIEGQTITFTLAKPEPVVVEVNGMHHALHLLPSPPEADVPRPDGVRYFGPGVHHPGVIELKSSETVYLAPGAVVYGSLHGNGVSHVRILGRGILDQSPFERDKGGGSIRLSDCSDVHIEGLVLRDPDVWCLSMFGCHDVTLRGLKLVGLWRYNADGIDVCNSQNVTVEDCFVRAYDDALVVKGLKWGGNSFDDRPVRDVVFRRNTLWCDWGRAMEIGAETCAPEMANVRFEDSDIVFTTHIAMDIQHGDRAAIHDVHFERIRVEMDGDNPRPAMQQTQGERYQPADGYLPTLAVIDIRGTFYSQDKQRGTVRGVVFRDIDIWAPRLPASSFRGADAEHGVDDVTCAGWRLNGQPLGSLDALGIRLGEHVRGVRYGSGGPE